MWITILVGLSIAGMAPPVRAAGATSPVAPVALPAACSPSASLAARLAGQAPVTVKTGGSSGPIKDLGIQPLTISRPEEQSLLDLAVTAGAGVVNAGVSWASVEPNGPRVAPGAWSRLTQFVKDVRARGMAVRLQLYGFPQWARASGDSTAQWLAPEGGAELGRWATWIRTIVDHFGNSVSFYEIWNEENEVDFWAQGPDPSSYAALLTCSYVASKRADLGATIVSGGLSTNDVGYLEHLYSALSSYPHAASFRDFFDLLGVHPYSGGRSPSVNQSRWVSQSTWGVDDTNFLGFRKLHAVMKQHGQGYKQLYIGEYGTPVSGYQSTPPPGFTEVSESARSSFVTLAYHLAAKSPYVVALSWYTFYPDEYDGAAWALVRNPDGSVSPTTRWVVTPSFTALAAVADAHLEVG
jgi:hypothetical protein